MFKTVKKILYILPNGEAVKLAILLMLMLVAAILEVAGIGMIPVFVAIVANPERIMHLQWLQPLLSLLEITNNRELLIWGSIGLVTIFLLKSFYIIGFNYFEARYIYNRRYIISLRLMRSYMHAPYEFHLMKNSAELLRNLSSEINVFINSVVANLLKMSREGIMALSILIFLFVMEPLITLMVILLSGIGAGTFILLNKKKMKEYGKQEQQLRMETVKAIYEGLSGIKDARVLNREEEFVERFRQKSFKSTRLMAYIRFLQQIPRPVVETTAVFGMLFVSLLLVWQDKPMGDIIPILTLFAMAIVRLMPSVQQLITNYTNVRFNLVAIDPIYEDLRKLEDSNTKFIEERKNVNPIKLNNKIELRNVRYRYPASNEHAVNGISISIPKSKAVGFVGSSGAGKTTIVDIILGLLEPDEGEIYVDGIAIRENISAWQRNVGYISQSIYLADDTLRSNIAFGLPESEIDEQKVLNAVRLSQLETMVNRLPDGLDTILGEYGTRLSGGQRQRVGIARALYHNPQVIVMDEATSSLDNITERRITRAIESLKGEHTLLIIAHRLTTVKNCDTLYFMEEGKIVQEGTYQELVNSNSQFRKMALEG